MHESDRAPAVVGSDNSSTPVEFAAARAVLERQAVWCGYVERIAGKDQGSLATLYDESSGMVYGLALRILNSPADAEEVAMDVYAQVWRSAGGYDSSRGSVVAWLATMARTRAIDRLRARTPRIRSEQPLAPLETTESGASTEADAIRRLDARRVVDAVLVISPDQRQVLSLAYFSGMSHSEIATHLQLPVGTVKTRIRLGLSKLRTILQGEYE